MIPAALVLGSFALAFAQRPGKAVFDTRIELSADPSLFLHRVAQVWSATGDLGHVQSGQFVGYLFPMAPWFAFVQWTGMPVWVGQRLWLGALIALAALGVVRLLDELLDRRRGVAHLAAGALYAANPYVAVWMTRGTVALLAYAAVPWLLLAAHRGMREPRGWRWPALIGLLLAASGAGVNAAVVVWILPAPLALMLYEAGLGRGGRALWSFGWRAGVCAVVGSAWWALPLLVQARYGTDFLRFTELPSSVWATPSVSESLRLLGYWLLYLGLAGKSVVGLASTYLFSGPVIVATLLVPLFAFAGLRWTRRWSYAPFFCLLGVGTLGAMAAGFPGGTPLRSVLITGYHDLEPLRFLRTSYKAAPLLATALACLAGPALATLVTRIRAARPTRTRRRLAMGGLAAAATSVVALYALPIFKGRAIDHAQAYGTVPAAWRAAIADAESTTPADRRILLLPGALFGSYRWGSTTTSIATALSTRPLLVRELVPYADPRAADLQATVDDLVQQDRLVPGQLPALLRLMAVGTVIVNADGLPLQSGSLDPVGVSEALREQPGLTRARARFGATRTYQPVHGRSGALLRVPDLRTYRLPPARDGIVRVQPVGSATVLDGDAEGIVELAAVGRLRPDRALFYAGDLRRSALAGQVRLGARLVFTDSNRRRVLEPDLLRANAGPTLGPDDPLPREWPKHVLFDSGAVGGQTVARLAGLHYARSPVDRGLPIAPQHRAYAALDGRLDTSWIGNGVASPSGRYIALGLDRPRTIRTLALYPVGAGAVAVSVNGGHERRFFVHRGWNELPLGASRVRTLRVRLPSPAGPAGIAELRVPGLHVTEALRLPRDLAAEARGLDLSHSGMAIVLSRTTADLPRRARSANQDAEAGLDRIVTLPAARRFGVRGWASIDPTASDAAIDRLVGIPGGWSFVSSDRFEGVPGRRASSAFDGRPATAWAAAWGSGRAPWLQVRGPRTLTVRRLRLVRGPSGYAVPARVRVAVPGGAAAVATVGADGAVGLARPLEGRTLRITVLATRPNPGPVGSLPAVAVGDVEIPGLRPPAVRRGGAFATACGGLTVSDNGSTATARASGTVAALDAGQPLRLRGCGPHAALPVPQGASHLLARAGSIVRPDHLELAAPAPVPLAPPPPPGAVVSPGSGSDGSREHVRLRLDRPAWLVYGDSYSGGWRAWCRNPRGSEHSLGSPVPIDGFANGWRVNADCREARFEFAPQRLADVGYAVSAVACGGMLVMVLLPLLLRRRRLVRAASATTDGAQAAAPPPAGPVVDPVRRPGWAGAAAAGVISGLLGWFCFGGRGGVVAAVGVAAVLLWGVSVRRLIALATVGLAALPILYLVDPAPRPRGLAFTYATHYLVAHWVGVAAVACLAGAGLLGTAQVAAARRRRHAGADAPAVAGAIAEPSGANHRPARDAGRSTGAGRSLSPPS